MPERGKGGMGVTQYMADQLTLFQLGKGRLSPYYFCNYCSPQTFSPSGTTDDDKLFNYGNALFSGKTQQFSFKATTKIK
jgi:hypothetical protein